MQIFDTHCHYNMSPLAENWQDHWQKAQAVGVVGACVVGTNIETSHKAVEVASQSEHKLVAAVGVHPTEYFFDQPTQRTEEEISNRIAQDLEKLEQLLSNTSADTIKAIGESGLDYFHFSDEYSIELQKKIQKQLCIGHINLANTFSKTLILHVRDTQTDAYTDVLELVKEHKNPETTFILHCVSGPTEYVSQALKLGAYVSVAGNVTYKSADHIRELALLTPADKLLTETDAPFLAPQGFRGQTCEPHMIEHTASFINSLTAVSFEQLVENAHTVFAIQ